MSTFTIDGVRIYVREEGPANAQVALMIHGWSSSWYAMSPLLPLISRRYRCIAVDLPGYGNSPRPDRPISIPLYANLLTGLIRELTDNPVVLIGHSMGGMTSLTLAREHPELVERMVLICPTISGQLSTFIKLFISPITMMERFTFADKLLAAVEPGLVRVTDRLMRPVSFAERTDISQEDYQRLRADARRPGQGRVRAECYRAMRANDLRGRLAAIETPSLVIWGAEDNTVPLRDAGVIADELRNADLRIIPKAGHWPHFECPSQTRKIIAAYLGLPVISSRPDESSAPGLDIGPIAEFLANSDVGSNLSLPQRLRLAGQCRVRAFPPGATIARANEDTSDMLIVQKGTVEVWSPPLNDDPSTQRQISSLLPGQITGEMALIDGGRRSADLRAGPEGAMLLALRRDRLVALMEDDPALGTPVIWNVAAALALRLRLSNIQQQQLAERLREQTVQLEGR